MHLQNQILFFCVFQSFAIIATSESRLEFQFIIPCLQQQDFNTELQAKLIQSLADQIGFERSNFGISFFEGRGLQTAASRRLMSISSSPGILVEMFALSSYETDTVLIKQTISDSLISLSLRLIGVQCPALMQTAPAVVHSAPHSPLTIQDNYPANGDRSSIEMNNRILMDGVDGSVTSAVWFRIEPSSGNVTGGSIVLLYGLFFDETASNYICSFSSGNNEVFTSEISPRSSSLISFVLPPWPYSANQTLVTLLKKSAEGLKTIPWDGTVNGFEFKPYWYYADLSRGPAAGGAQITLSAVGLSNDTSVEYFCVFQDPLSFERVSSSPANAVWSPNVDNAYSVTCVTPPWPFTGSIVAVTLRTKWWSNDSKVIDFGGCSLEKERNFPNPELRVMVPRYVSPSFLCQPFLFHYEGEYDASKTRFQNEVYLGSNSNSEPTILSYSSGGEATITGFGSAAGGTRIEIQTTASSLSSEEQYIFRFQEELTSIIPDQKTINVTYTAYTVDTQRNWTERASKLMKNQPSNLNSSGEYHRPTSVPDSTNVNLRYWFSPESFKEAGLEDGATVDVWKNSAQIGCTVAGCTGRNQTANGLPLELGKLHQSSKLLMPAYRKEALNGHGSVRFRRQNSVGSRGQYLEISNFSQQTSNSGNPDSFVNPFSSNGGTWTVFLVSRTEEAESDSGAMGIFQASSPSSAGYTIWKRTSSRLPAGQTCQNKSICYVDHDNTCFSTINAGISKYYVDNSCVSICSKGCSPEDCMVANTPSGKNRSVTTIDPESWRIISIVCNGSALSVYVDGAHGSPQPPLFLQGTSISTNFRLGCTGPNSTYCTSFMSGEIAEVLFYDRDLQVDELDSIGFYLSTKFGLSSFRVNPSSWPVMNFTTHYPAYESCKGQELVCETAHSRGSPYGWARACHAVASRGSSEVRVGSLHNVISCITPIWPWQATTTTVTLWKKSRGDDYYSLVLPKPFGNVHFSFTEIWISLSPTLAPAAGGIPITIVGFGFGSNYNGSQALYTCKFAAAAPCFNMDGSQCEDMPQRIDVCEKGQWNANCTASQNFQVSNAHISRNETVTDGSVFAVCNSPVWQGTAFGTTMTKVTLWKQEQEVLAVDSRSQGIVSIIQTVTGFLGQICACDGPCKPLDIMICPGDKNTTVDAAGGSVIVLNGYGFNAGSSLRRYTVKIWNSRTESWCVNVRILSSTLLSCTTSEWGEAAQEGYMKSEESDPKITVFYDGIAVSQTVGGLKFFESYSRIFPTNVSSSGGALISVQGAGFNSTDYAYKCVFTSGNVQRQSEPVAAVRNNLITCRFPFVPISHYYFNFTLLKCALTMGDFPSRTCSLIAISSNTMEMQQINIISEAQLWTGIEPMPGWTNTIGFFEGFNQLRQTYRYNNPSISLSNDVVQMRGTVFASVSKYVILSFDQVCPSVCSPSEPLQTINAQIECNTAAGQPYVCQTSSNRCGVCEKESKRNSFEYFPSSQCQGLEWAECSLMVDCVWNQILGACPSGQKWCPQSLHSGKVHRECSQNNSEFQGQQEAFVAEVEQGLISYLAVSGSRVRAVGAQINQSAFVKIIIAPPENIQEPSVDQIVRFLLTVLQCKRSKCSAPGWIKGREYRLPIRKIRPFSSLASIALAQPPTSIMMALYFAGVPQTLETQLGTVAIGDLRNVLNALSNTEWQFTLGSQNWTDNAFGSSLHMSIVNTSMFENGTYLLQVVVAQDKSVIDFDPAESQSSIKIFSPVEFAKELSRQTRLGRRSLLTRIGRVLQYVVPEGLYFTVWGFLDQHPVIASIEPSFRPEFRTVLICPCSHFQVARIDIFPDGRMVWITGGESVDSNEISWISLDGIAFRRDPLGNPTLNLCFQPPFVDVDFQSPAEIGNSTFRDFWNNVNDRNANVNYRNDSNTGSVMGRAVYSKVQYRRLGNMLHLRGVAVCPSNTCFRSSVLFQLEPSLRPYQDWTFCAPGTQNKEVRLDVLSDGRVLYGGLLRDDFKTADHQSIDILSVHDHKFQVGIQVRIQAAVLNPFYGWQRGNALFNGEGFSLDANGYIPFSNVSHISVGIITKIDESTSDVWIDFDDCKNWLGKLQELEPVGYVQWISLDNIVFPITQNVLTEGMVVQSTTATPYYGWEQGRSRVAVTPNETGIITDIGCIHVSTLLNYTDGASGSAELGPDDVMVDFSKHKFWRGVRSELVSIPPVWSLGNSIMGWKFLLNFTNDAAQLVYPWNGDGGLYCTGGSFSGQSCSRDADCMDEFNFTTPNGTVFCAMQSYAFHTYQNGRTYLFGVVQTSQKWNLQRVIAYLPVGARPSGETQIFHVLGALKGNSSLKEPSTKYRTLASVWLNIHGTDGRIEIAFAPPNIGWISLAGISFSPL